MPLEWKVSFFKREVAETGGVERWWGIGKAPSPFHRLLGPAPGTGARATAPAVAAPMRRMAPAQWTPTAHCFAHHLFSQVSNFWSQGRDASFHLKSLNNGQAEMSLVFRLPHPSEIIPPPSPYSTTPFPTSNVTLILLPLSSAKNALLSLCSLQVKPPTSSQDNPQ